MRNMEKVQINVNGLVNWYSNNWCKLKVKMYKFDIYILDYLFCMSDTKIPEFLPWSIGAQWLDLSDT